MSEVFEIRAEAERSMPLALDDVWGWLEALPGAFEVFPMLSEYRELSPDLYALSLGRIGFGRWKVGVECVVRVDTSSKPVYRFVPVPGEGNSEAAIEMTLSAIDAGATRVHVRALVTPHIRVPRGAPLGLISRTVGATMAVALRRMLQGIEREAAASAAQGSPGRSAGVPASQH